MCCCNGLIGDFPNRLVMLSFPVISLIYSVYSLKVKKYYKITRNFFGSLSQNAHYNELNSNLGCSLLQQEVYLVSFNLFIIAELLSLSNKVLERALSFSVVEYFSNWIDYLSKE